MSDSIMESLEAPCAICGYNGANYWQRESHDRSCPWHFLAGAEHRKQAIRALMPRLRLVCDNGQLVKPEELK